MPRSFDARRSGRAALVTCALALAVLAAARPALATDKYAAEFLRVGAGARALGMGGAFLAVADDATAGYWNPAGLNFLKNKSLLYMHSEEQKSQVHYDFLAVALPQGGDEGERSALGISLVRLGVDDIPVTPAIEDLRPGIDFEDGDGDPSTNLSTENNGRWDPGERLFLTDFDLKSSNDFAGLFSYSKDLSKKFTMGASVKVLYRTLVGHSAWGAGLDLAGMYNVRPNVTLAVVAKDLTSTLVSWDTGRREHVAPSLAVGGQVTHAFSPQHVVTLAADVRTDFEGRRTDSNFGSESLAGEMHVGAEYWFHNSLALRSGIDGRDLTFGAGLRNKQLGVDFAAMFNRFFESDGVTFAGDEDQGVGYRVSGSFDW
jgi:hypothetical protein